MKKSLGILVAAAACLPGIAVCAEGIGVNAASIYGIEQMWPLAAGTSEGVVPLPNWVNIGTANTGEGCGSIVVANLHDNHGRPTGARLRLDLVQNYNTIMGIDGGPQSGFTLFKGGLTSHYGGTPRVTVEYIPYASYDVIAYIIPNTQMGAVLTGTDDNGVFTRSIPVTSAGSVFNAFDDATTDGIGNYIVWPNLTGGTFTLTMDKGNGDRKFFTALQIVNKNPISALTVLVR